MNARTLFVLWCSVWLMFPCRAQVGDFLKALPGRDGRPGGAAKSIGIATNAIDLFKSAGGIPLEEELHIGGSVAVEIVARFGGIFRDTHATRRVNLIGKSLARYGNRPELGYRFGLLNSPEINAFSAPGGYIFITKGLYDLANTEDQLAGVLAHEIAHVTERHALKIISRNKAFAAGIRLGAAATKELREFGQGIESITQVLFDKGFDPNTEFAADREARRIASLTGYGPDGLKQVLLRMSEKEASGGRMFSTHPSHAARISKLDAAVNGPKP